MTSIYEAIRRAELARAELEHNTLTQLDRTACV